MFMRSLTVVVVALALASPLGACAASNASTTGSNAAAASHGTAEDFLKRYDRLTSRVVDLCTEMTAEQLGWRPGEGVRSMIEVLGHLTVTQYKLAAFTGVPIPADVDLEALEKLTTKDEALAAMKASNTHARAAIARLTDAAMAQPAEVWGKPSTVRFAALLIVAHQAEHLGQAVAYARMNGVVPPWSR